MRPPVALPRLDTSTISFHRSRRSRTATIKIEAKGIVIDIVKTSAMTPTISGYARGERSPQVNSHAGHVHANGLSSDKQGRLLIFFANGRPQYFDLGQEHLHLRS